MPEGHPVEIEWPPHTRNGDGEPRRIGIELEFAGLALTEAAQAVADLFGGHITWEDAHRASVDGTRFGTFIAELDSDYVHPSRKDATVWAQIEEQFMATVGDVIEAWMPREITSPPLPLADLPEIDRLCAALRAKGVLGTRAKWRYAFAVQLNPEVQRLDCPTVLDTFRAFLLLSDWLHSMVAHDRLRALLAFAKPFPRAYTRKVLDPSYRPDWPQFIEDYLAANPNRNRDLDLCPLFAFIDEARVRRHLRDERIKARPTYHYRLPDSRIEDPEWSIVSEWNRWVLVERLAASPERLAARRDRFLHHFIDAPSHAWVKDTVQWLNA